MAERRREPRPILQPPIPKMTTSQQPSTARRKLTFLAGFTLYFATLWFLWDTPVVYPLKIFVVMLHEISHGIASLTTAGSIE